MNEKIIKHANGKCEVSFESILEASQKDVWDLLTTNEGLAQWFHELEVGELGKQGYFNFIMTPTERLKMLILNYEEQTLIELEWDENSISFQLENLEKNKVKLLFKEELKNITEHTSRDIAGWNLCLHRIKLVLAEEIEPTVNQDKFDVLVARYQNQLTKLEQE